MTLYKRLSKADEGEVITYAELSELIKSDVQGQAYCYMTTARNRARANDQMVFESVRGVGLRRVPNEKISDVTETYLDRSRRQARKGIKVLACADYDRLDHEGRKKYNFSSAMLGAINLATSGKVQKRIASAASDGRLSMDATLALFQRDSATQ